MKKAFSLGAGVFLYAETRKLFYSTKDMLVSEREILDEESIFSRCRRILMRQDGKMFSATKDVLVSEREVLDEESIFSRCRRILIR